MKRGSTEGTNPNAWDSDSDYIADYWELYNYFTDPTKADSDGDLIADGKEIEMDPSTEDITIITNPLVYNDFDEDKTEIRQNIERDALSVSDDNRVTVVVDYPTASHEKPQITETGAYEYQISSSISENLKAEIRMKLGDSMIQELQSDPYKYRMYWYDDSEGEWKIFRHTDVDLDNGYMWGVITHFTKVGIENTGTSDSDHDGLTDEYEMTHTFPIIEYPCESSPADEGWEASSHLDPWVLVSGGNNSQHSWKAGAQAMHSYEMQRSIDLEMSPSNPLYLEFDYKYSQSSELSYFSVTTLLDIGYYYPSVSLQTDGNWHSVEPINLCPNRYPYYEITEDFKITDKLLRIHFYSHETGDVLRLDNMKITRHLDKNNPDTDGDGLYDGWKDANRNGIWDSNEEKGEVGDPDNNNAGGYGTSPVNMDTDGDGISDRDEAQGQVTRYAVDMGNKGYLFYTEYPWVYSADYTIRTFYYHTHPLIKDTDMDGQSDNTDLIPLDYDMDGDGYINSLEIVDPDSAYYESRFALAASRDKNLIRWNDGSFHADIYDMDGDTIIDQGDLDDDNDGMPDNYEMSHGVANGGWQNPYVFNARYAILVGGGDTDSGRNYDAFKNDLIEMHNTLTTVYKWNEKNIYSYLWDGSDFCGGMIDGAATVNTITDEALPLIGLRITVNDFFYFFEVSHGGVRNGKGYFQVYDTQGDRPVNVAFSFNLLGLWTHAYLNGLWSRSLFVFASCNSGHAISELREDYTIPNSIVISSTRPDELGYTWEVFIEDPLGYLDHSEFLHDDKHDGFTESLSKTHSILKAFYDGCNAAGDDDIPGFLEESTPLLDDNGDAIGHTKSSIDSDGFMAVRTWL